MDAMVRWMSFQRETLRRLQEETGWPVPLIIERFAGVIRRDFGECFFGGDSSAPIGGDKQKEPLKRAARGDAHG